MEAIQPARDGLRVEGDEANVAFWRAMVTDRIADLGQTEASETEVSSA